MSNSSLLILSDPAYSHQFKVTVSKPDGTPYSVFTSDQVSGNIESSSFATSKSFDAPPVVLGNLLSSGLNESIILSRQLIGWPAKIDVVSTNGVTAITNQVWKGRVNGFSKSGNYWSIELTNSILELDKGATLSLSANCPLVFGKCGATKTSVEIAPTSITAQVLNITPVSFTPTGLQKYQVVVGDSAYSVTGFVIAAGLLSAIFLDRVPAATPSVAFLENTCNQSLALCKEGYNNTVNYRGVVLPSSVLSLTL